MAAHELLITCPMCGKKFSLHGASNHRRKNHKEITMGIFVEAVRKARREGALMVKKVSLEGSGIDTATSVLQERARLSIKGPVRVVGGGSFGLKK